MSEGQTAAKYALPMTEFVTLMAFLMALTALSVDIMLPVLPDIVATYGLDDPNKQQFMVTVYLAAFASGHIIAGPLSDRIGRRPVLLAGLAVYLCGTLIAIVAQSYTVLLIARAVQGLGASGPRVVAVAVVRDRFVGRGMSQVMSFIMTVFIMLPVVAPAIGAVLGGLGSWRTVFLFLLIFGICTAFWVALRLPESNPRTGPDAKPPVPILLAVKTLWSTPQTVGYMIALGFVFGCLMTYIATTQQIFADIYGIVDWFPLVFASVAGTMIISAVVNARLVKRVGMRRLSHGAALSLVALSAIAGLGLLVADPPHIAVLMSFLALAFFLIGLILPNFNALAMEPLGQIAGTGSAFVGFVMTGLGVLLGGAAGQFYDGTVDPLIAGFVLYSSVVVCVVALTERGKLMQPSVEPT
ncbi:MAG: multidrug effflux MFS transporter [Pseudomonadota bacterium]